MTLSQFIDEGNAPSGSWSDFFTSQEVQQELEKISSDIEEEKATSKSIIYPVINKIFRAFYLTPLTDIKIVILGMDPYHNGSTEFDGSAIGLCFSVREGNQINPSLKNIYKELIKSGNQVKNQDGNLLHWASQGILLLNTSLTVNKGDAGSHLHIWNNFSEMVIKYIDSKRKKDVHWLLFGSDSHQLQQFIKYGVVHKTTHPSPFSANKSSKTAPAFIGSGVFNQIPYKIFW